MLDLVFRNLTDNKTFKEGFFVDILNVASNELRFEDKKVELSLNLVGESKIKKLNKKYRNKDSVTDVLSFPLDYKDLSKRDIISLGDIFICLPFASEQAEKEGMELKKVLSRLVVHGFLHLVGYDHERSAKEEKKMFGLENKILKKIFNG